MAYCTITNVQGLNPKRPTYSGSTTPTSTQVEQFIDDIAAEIDSILEGRSYTTPVTAGTTSAKFLEWLEALNARGAAALAEQAQFPELAGQLGGTGAGSQYWKQYREGLAYLKNGAIPGGSSGDDLALPFSFMSDNYASDEEPGLTDPAWSRPKFGINKDF